MPASTVSQVRKQIADRRPDPIYVIVGDDEAAHAQLVDGRLQRATVDIQPLSGHPTVVCRHPAGHERGHGHHVGDGDRIREAGTDVQPRAIGADLPDELDEAGIETHVLPLAPGLARARKDALGWRSLMRVGLIVWALRYVWRLARFIKKRRIDLVSEKFLAGILLVTLVACGVHRWVQVRRRARIKLWISDYLASRYGRLPDNLHINCTDDQLWPVIVTFNVASGSRHVLHFNCAGAPTKFCLASEQEEPLPQARNVVQAA